MFDLLSHRLDRARSELRPGRALLTPTWIAALAVLVANDHWLKGSGLIPGVLTGKLSDFAGMLVAPALLAAVLGVRSRRALLACHVAVAAVFAGIQLSPAFASQWSALMAVLGHPWAITCDVSDLIALPFLALSWIVLVPEMDAELPALAPLQRSAVGALSVLGLWSTVATSDVDGGIDPNDVWYEDVFGHVVVNNANDVEIAIHVRTLRDDVALDCDQVSADPGRLLSEDAFAEAEHWLLPGRTTVAIEFAQTRECGAAWIAGEGIEPTIVFVELAQHPATWWAGQIFDPASLPSGAVGVQFDEQGPGEWIGDASVLFRPTLDTPEQPESCEASGDEARLDWPLSIPKRQARVTHVEAGVDGCFALGLQEVVFLNNELSDEGEPYDFYLCAPEAAVPFAVDELLSFTDFYANDGAHELRVTLLDPATLTSALSESGEELRVVRYLRGGSDPALIGPAIGRDLVAVPAVGCPWQVDEDCATVDRRVDLAVAGGSSYLVPGSPVSFADVDANMVHTAVLGYAREHAVLDQSCADGAVALRYDIDLAVVDEGGLL